ncbi:ABC-F family ATP-binding cassette domain-containing protein [Mesobacillus subterraneus]|uniref:Multidrug ABC transporter ATP-binding protein n=1 Tax=Mesobacillus subterraneus TaxID=285983 RepID=A0A0D6ZCG5_9BACI|nr:ABC-F family ATP-binding cassette domain-containing protein [Mesobacillus subterraneus]KIY22273.1 multidrug ABC transporter ATP-binding protein [Mesobacillus subterraneus]
MKMITIENVTKTYGEKELFNSISFTIGERERIGLIGVNGTGKSSLLRIVAGMDQPDTGELFLAKDYKISFLSQQPEMNPEKTVLDQVFSGEAPILELLRQYEMILADLGRKPDDLAIQQRFYELQRRMDSSDGWDANTAAKSILMQLGISDFTRTIAELSGGQKKRVALAQVLIEAPDLLILDEPTNHLDYETVKWLEDYLSRYSGSLLLVTHDRYFLDRVTNRIFELDGGNLYSYKGNYASFLEAKAIREENEAATVEKKKNLFRQELEWIRRGAKARTTKQKARIQRFDQLDEEVSNGKSTEKLDISLSGSRLGKQVLELKDATKKYEDKLILNDFHLLVKPGDRLGIIGRNGTGKSTLLNILSGRVDLDSGEIITGQTVKIVYYTQENEDLDENKRVIEYLKETAEMVHTTDGKIISAAQMLERFLFPPYAHGTLIRKLSGGEKRRLYLLKLLMEEPNVLLLDEPTNDLDTQTLTVLEDYLEEFPGVVITVSHDRYFLDKVVDLLLVLEGNGRTGLYYGNYTDYLEKRPKADSVSSPTKKEKVEQPEKPKKKKLSFKEQKEWAEIDEELSNTEARLEEVQTEMVNIGSDFEKGQALMKEAEKLNEHLEYLIERWSYLSELVDE